MANSCMCRARYDSLLQISRVPVFAGFTEEKEAIGNLSILSFADLC